MSHQLLRCKNANCSTDLFIQRLRLSSQKIARSGFEHTPWNASSLVDLISSLCANVTKPIELCLDAARYARVRTSKQDGLHIGERFISILRPEYALSTKHSSTMP